VFPPQLHFVVARVLERLVFLTSVPIIVTLLCTCGATSRGAEPDVVGVLALALEEDVSATIGLSPEVRDKLLDLVHLREMDALDLALRLRDLPASERSAQLAPFRSASEQLGLKLLTTQQRRSLRAIRIGRQGMQSLGESDVSKQLKLTPAQESDVGRLLA